MKQSRFSIRLLALLFSGAIALTTAACSQNTVEPAPGESSSSVSQPAGIPAFINPLGDVDLSRLSTAEKPREGPLLLPPFQSLDSFNCVVGHSL